MLGKQKKTTEIIKFKNLDDFSENEKIIEEDSKVTEEIKKLKLIEKNIDKYLVKVRKKIIKESKSVVSNTGKPTQMVIDEKSKRTNVSIFSQDFSVEHLNGEYRVSVKDAEIHALVTKPNIKVLCGKIFVYIEKHEYLYCVVTNIPVSENLNILHLEEEEKVYSFSVENLSAIDVFDNLITLKNDNEADEIKDNDTLFISQEEGKVYLPYKVEDLVEELKLYPNITLKQLIKVKYIQPIERYKFSIKARYTEAYELMREKEKKSVTASMMLGLELMFEFNLHPAVITACKNLEQLDIYLDCLDDNELEKFTCFKIAYKALPTLAKLKKMRKSELEN